MSVQFIYGSTNFVQLIPFVPRTWDWDAPEAGN